MEKVRTRFAPSPTGYMHIGNLRTALFAYLTAKSKEGDFLLRIEDTDQKRYVEGAVQFIYDTLNLCQIEIDEGPLNGGEVGPYSQSERLDIYREYAHKLVEMGKAYYCFCNEDRLNQLREEADLRKVPFMYDGCCKNLSLEEVQKRIAAGEPYVIRQMMPKEGISEYEDLVYGKIQVENKILEDQILLKSDGYPTYNFANVIDDHLMHISHVIRGNEYVMSTPKYNLLYDAFGWDKPTYIHLPMVLGQDGQKLSKRNGDASFMDLYREGYLPEAICNYLVLLGWSPETNDEIFSMEDLIRVFDPKRISKAPASYDVKKLNWVNAHYMKQLDVDRLLSITLPHLKETYDLSNYDDEWLRELVCLYQNHISFGKEIVAETKLFFQEELELSEDCAEFMKQDGISGTLQVFKEKLTVLETWTVEGIAEALQQTKEEAGVKGKMLYMPIRIQVSGLMHGPELPNTIHLLGRDKVLQRLN